MDTENIEEKKNTEFSELNFLRNVRSIFSDWMRRKEFDPQENLKHIFFAALEPVSYTHLDVYKRQRGYLNCCT